MRQEQHLQLRVGLNLKSAQSKRAGYVPALNLIFREVRNIGKSINIKLEKYGISENLYKELHAFCKQYNEKKEKLNSCYGLRSTSFVNVSRGFHFSDPTERAIELAEKYKKDIDLIENTAKEVDAYFAPFIIKNVTEDVPPWALQTTYGMAAGEKLFNKKRREFYFLLAHNKNCI